MFELNLFSMYNNSRYNYTRNQLQEKILSNVQYFIHSTGYIE